MAMPLKNKHFFAASPSISAICKSKPFIRQCTQERIQGGGAPVPTPRPLREGQGGGHYFVIQLLKQPKNAFEILQNYLKKLFYPQRFFREGPEKFSRTNETQIVFFLARRILSPPLNKILYPPLNAVQISALQHLNTYMNPEQSFRKRLREIPSYSIHAVLFEFVIFAKMQFVGLEISGGISVKRFIYAVYVLRCGKYMYAIHRDTINKDAVYRDMADAVYRQNPFPKQGFPDRFISKSSFSILLSFVEPSTCLCLMSRLLDERSVMDKAIQTLISNFNQSIPALIVDSLTS